MAVILGLLSGPSVGIAITEEQRGKIMSKGRVAAVFASMFLGVSARASADEGMWLLNHLPKDDLKAKYGFVPDDAWVEMVQRSCIRVDAGGSASFVSADGLLMTNHHVASDIIADLSDAEHDYIRDGFYARTRAEELRCPKVELSVLMKIEEVTDRVNAGSGSAASPAAAQEARKLAMAAIEKEAKDRTGLHPEIVELYHGARYHLYLYKRYTDVRLVFAPESEIAFFGGDLDNFEYPRFNLDISFLRAYEDGKPAKTPDHLAWSANGPGVGELTFIVGHPGRTQRLYTVEHLHFLRDVHIPLILNCHNQREIALLQFCGRSDEHNRIGKEDLLSVQNGRKAYCGIIEGLLDTRLMKEKERAQASLTRFIASDSERQKKYGAACQNLAKALSDLRPSYAAYFLTGNRRSSLCRLFDIARKLVRAAEERPKPDGKRYEEFRDANLASLELDLFSPAPIYAALEEFRLRDGLIRLGRVLGGDHPMVKTALEGQGPAGRAADLVAGTKLMDVAYRKSLYNGGTSAVAESKDPMILFAKTLEPASRRLRDQYENEFESVQTEAYAKLAGALFEMHGDRVYPDATFTLRLAIGTVEGYEEGGLQVPAMTTIGGAFERAEQRDYQPPYNLPKRWREGQDKLDPATPFNFVCTNDIIGGNSGSPIFNRRGEIVGIVFDGNIHGLIWDFQFDQTRARAIGVHSQAIIEALSKLYDAKDLVAELHGHRSE